VRGATALVASAEEAGQPRWVGWLEGETTSGPFGLDAEWSAFALRLDPAGQSSGEPLELGMADVVDERQVVILGSVLASGEAGPESGDEYARALWLGVDGTLQLTTIQATDDGGEVVDILDLEESGRPLAVSAKHAYWHDAEFVRRTTLVGAASDVTGSQAISVAWSPVIIAGAEFAVVGSEGAPDRTV